MTDMRIVKVVIEGELPEGCEECELCRFNNEEQGSLLWCSPMNTDVSGYAMRPLWCPLKKEGENPRASLHVDLSVDEENLVADWKDVLRLR